ncbi:MAG: hypothetical protein FJW38_15005 [Acidobacteria bacterium]|nr:hypothetical protein [Acidobacteriota bacterium]
MITIVNDRPKRNNRGHSHVISGMWKLLVATLALGAETPLDIMAKAAANIESATESRRQYVYQQKVRSRLLRTNGKVARQELRLYDIVPGAESTEKKLVSVEGEFHDGKSLIPYSDPEFRSKKLDIDGELADQLTGKLVDDSNSRDGIPKKLFPLRAAELPYYQFRLIETKDYKGRPTHHIAFDPIGKPKCDDECHGQWKGEAWIDAAEYQPVHIATEWAVKVPFVVRTIFGSNLRQSGFAVTYQRLAENVWFPVSYGTEFRLDVLFGYKRVITLALESLNFKRTAADTSIQFQLPNE